MPRTRLTDRTVKAIDPPETGQVDYFDERLPGFALRVSERGHKSWIVMFRHAGRLRRLTLGSYPQLPLVDARTKAKEALRSAANGQDPADEKRVERRAETFAELADEYLEHHAKVKKRTWREDERMIEHDLLPAWRNVKAKKITRRDVRDLLDGIVARGAPIQANRALALARKMFNFAIQRDIIADNPCRALPRPAQEHQRERVLSAEEIRALWHSLDGESGSIAALFRLHLLTAQRGGELVGMRWDELDLESAWWTLPAERSKNGCAHRVPLSAQALSILHDLRASANGSSFVFPNRKGTAPAVTEQKPVRRLRKASGVEFTPHDLRRTAASHMTSMGISRLTVSKILNHVERGVTAVYDRHSYDQEKRLALEAWGARVEEIVTRSDADASAASQVSQAADEASEMDPSANTSGLRLGAGSAPRR